MLYMPLVKMVFMEIDTPFRMETRWKLLKSWQNHKIRLLPGGKSFLTQKIMRKKNKLWVWDGKNIPNIHSDVIPRDTGYQNWEPGDSNYGQQILACCCKFHDLNHGRPMMTMMALTSMKSIFKYQCNIFLLITNISANSTNTYKYLQHEPATQCNIP